MSPPKGLHCWHIGGFGMTNGMGTGGYTVAHCCHCGERQQATWRSEEREVEGHGPHYTETERIYEALPATGCVPC